MSCFFEILLVVAKTGLVGDDDNDGDNDDDDDGEEDDEEDVDEDDDDEDDDNDGDDGATASTSCCLGVWECRSVWARCCLPPTP